MRYAAVYVHEQRAFRLAELHSLLDQYAVSATVTECEERDSPIVWIDCDDERALINAISNSVLLVRLMLVIAEGPNIDAMLAQCEQPRAQELIRARVLTGASLCVRVSNYGRRVNRTEHQPLVSRIVTLCNSDIRIAVRDAERKLYAWIDHGLPAIEPTAEWNVRRAICGMRVCKGSRHLLRKYSLSTRDYIGPTSMDTELALLSAIMAQCRPGTLAMDPFCGTGGNIVMCAALGARVIGVDRDWRVLVRGRNGKKVRSNFVQYNLPMPELLLSDTAAPCFRASGFLDAIVTDPPYGVRAGARRVAPKRATPAAIPEEMRKDHVPQTVPYTLVEVATDLLQFAAKRLAVGGRLVFWLPTTRTFVDDEHPSHPCLERLFSCEQVMGKRWSRRLVVMRKFTEFVDGMRPLVREFAFELEDDDAHADSSAPGGAAAAASSSSSSSCGVSLADAPSSYAVVRNVGAQVPRTQAADSASSTT